MLYAIDMATKAGATQARSDGCGLRLPRQPVALLACQLRCSNMLRFLSFWSLTCRSGAFGMNLRIDYKIQTWLHACQISCYLPTLPPQVAQLSPGTLAAMEGASQPPAPEDLEALELRFRQQDR